MRLVEYQLTWESPKGTRQTRLTLMSSKRISQQQIMHADHPVIPFATSKSLRILRAAFGKHPHKIVDDFSQYMNETTMQRPNYGWVVTGYGVTHPRSRTSETACITTTRLSERSQVTTVERLGEEVRLRDSRNE